MWLKRKTTEPRSGGDVRSVAAPPLASHPTNVADSARELASSHRYAEALAAIVRAERMRRVRMEPRIQPILATFEIESCEVCADVRKDSKERLLCYQDK